MHPDPNQPDQAPDQFVDQILAALRTAAPPAGLESRIESHIETRIAQRLEQQPAPARSRLRGLLFGSSPRAIWLRGALTGAAFAAAFTLCALPLLRHQPFPTQNQTAALTPPAASPQTTHPTEPVSIQPASTQPRIPCPRPQLTRTPSPAQPQARPTPHLQTIALSHPAPQLPLTSQERQLVRLVRTASPAQLAAFNPEIEARRDAEETANFQKFFPPPPPRPTDSDTTPEPTHTANPLLND